MDNSNKIILDLCGGTGSWSRPYKDAGYDVRLITLPENDVLTYTPPENIYGILAAPPCTEFSTAKKWDIPRDLENAMTIVNTCKKIINASNPKFYAIENPAGLLKNFIGKPQYTFQPWWFGDPWTKRTCLWGNFNIPKRIVFSKNDLITIPGLYIKKRSALPELTAQHISHKKYIRSFDYFVAKTDADLRAITPPGFAKAFFKANQ